MLNQIGWADLEVRLYDPFKVLLCLRTYQGFKTAKFMMPCKNVVMFLYYKYKKLKLKVFKEFTQMKKQYKFYLLPPIDKRKIRI